jgi:nicotinamide-nucleotide amidase
MKNLNIQLLLTGDELMSGDVIDSNSCMMADILKTQGLVFTRKVTVGDNLDLLIQEIEGLSQQADVLIINGGLGPTVDDKTAEALGHVVHQPLVINQQAMDHLVVWCGQRGYELNEPNKKQALLPQGVGIVDNPIGSAPGFSYTHNDCLILATPGVPSEAKSMLQESILPILKAMNPEGVTQVKKLQLFGIGESTLQRTINDALPDWPQEIELGFRAAFPQIEVKLTAHDAAAIKQLDTWVGKLVSLFGAHILAEGDTQLPALVVSLLQEQQKQLTLAESCTGGLIAAKITSVAGASQVFEGGFVTYSNAIKTSVLGVSASSLQHDGAVSESVVKEMAMGALNITHANLAVAVSGIAGPAGGSEEKPVGTAWLAWGEKNNMKSQKLFYPGPRRYFQEYVASAALDLIRRELLGLSEAPWYFNPANK